MGDTVVTQPNTVVDNSDSQAHIDAMTAKADAGTGNDVPDNQGEQLIAGKFKTQEDLMKSIGELGGSLEDYYKSLESGMNKDTDSDKGAEQGTDQSGKEGDSDNSQNTDQDKDESSSAGLDFEKFTTEYANDGALSDESRQAIIDSGIPEDTLNQYLEGMEALATLRQQSAFNLVGGEDQYNQMIAWAGENLTEAEKKVFNDGIASTDPKTRDVHIGSLYTRFTQGSGPQLLSGDNAVNMGGAKYDSMAQFTADIRNPQYAKDPAFRAEVEAKLARSSIM